MSPMTMGDRITVMRDGVIQQVDTPVNLYRRPVNRFVATFIGSPTMNILPGMISGPAEAPQLKLKNGGHLALPPKQVKCIRNVDEAEILLGIRPECSQLQPAQMAKPEAIEVTVEIVEQMGSELYVHFGLGDFTYTARLAAEANVSEASRVTLFTDMAKCHIFDAHSEKNLLL